MGLVDWSPGKCTLDWNFVPCYALIYYLWVPLCLGSDEITVMNGLDSGIMLRSRS